MTLKFSKLPETKCPRCGGLIEAATSIYPDVVFVPFVPQGGDVVLCSECGLVLVFDDALQARPANVENIMMLKQSDPTAYGVLMSIKRALPIFQKWKAARHN